MKRVAYVRQDNNGDVLLQGPAIRAVAARAEVTLICGPRGAAAARALPAVREVLVSEAAWIDADPQPVDRALVEAFVDDVRARSFDEAIISTSFHQSPLPMALLLRMAGVPRIGAISVDYPGSLLDVRHHVDNDVHEVTRALSLAREMGYDLAAGDDARLRVTGLPAERKAPFASYVAVHPGSTAPARAWAPERNRMLVERLCAEGHNVVVTGSASEDALASFVAGDNVRVWNAAGRTSFAEFAAILRDARAVVCGNTAAAHVASAVGTPVVELFAPTIPAARFHPWMVPYALLGDQQAPCRGCRARTCPLQDQPCLSVVSVDDVLAALRSLVPPVLEVA